MNSEESNAEKMDENCEIVFFSDKQMISYDTWIENIEKEVVQELEKNPKDLKLLMILGQIYYKFKNDQESALKCFKQVLVEDPKNIDCRLELICLMLNKKYLKYECIDQLLDECFKLDPSYWRVYFVKGMYYNILDLQYQSIQILQIGLLMFPNNLWILVLLAQMYAYKSQNEGISEKFLQKALNFKKFNYEVLTGMSIIYLHQKKYEEAEKRLMQVIKLNKNSSAGYSFLSILSKFKDNDIDKSIEYSLQALQINPTNVNSLFNLSHCYQLKSNYEECVQNLKKLLQFCQDPLKIYDKLCYIYMYLVQNYDLVKYYHSKSIKINPSTPFSNLVFCKTLNQQTKILSSNEDFEISQIRLINASKNQQDGYLKNEYRNISFQMNQLLGQ